MHSQPFEDSAPREDLGDEPSGGGDVEPSDSPGDAAEGQAEEDVPAGPDVPAPSVDELRAAMDWAFSGEEVEASLLDIYAQHAHMLLDENRRVNLTAILDPKEVAAKHYLDSWRITQFLPLFGHTVVDVGTGGGFPAVPVAAAEPMARVTALDSTKKKVDFVQRSVDELGLKNVQVHWGRAEDFLQTERADFAIFRAVSSVRENVRTLRKVKQSVRDVVMLKGKSWSREVRAAEREAERLGFRLDTVWEHSLPGEMGEHVILVYQAPGSLGR
ncbi:MAG: 16S rRNA (guanine(527)-N(7))-methyltransferase RsmG [Planctomycetes bacterium]|nr:16S rRNA (guanine(527)-N(7))-methyltransferase RsmG [Planctomycetota bacterium]